MALRLVDAETALKFYANPMNWINDAADIGVGEQPIPETSTVSCDRGYTARTYIEKYCK